MVAWIAKYLSQICEGINISVKHDATQIKKGRAEQFTNVSVIFQELSEK